FGSAAPSVFRNSRRDLLPGAKDSLAAAESLIDSGLSFEIWLGPRPSVTAPHESKKITTHASATDLRRLPARMLECGILLLITFSLYLSASPFNSFVPACSKTLNAQLTLLRAESRHERQYTTRVKGAFIPEPLGV